MTARIIWSDQAKSDLNEFIDHYALVDLAFAETVSTKALAAADILALHPHAGQKIRHSVMRKWPVAKTPLLLIYEVQGRSVQIVRLVHNRSDWQDLA